jgi:hypothetical protein
LNAVTNKKFNIPDNVFEVVTQYALSTSNADRFAGERPMIFCEIQARHLLSIQGVFS